MEAFNSLLESDVAGMEVTIGGTELKVHPHF
jgi:hypothetical protein